MQILLLKDVNANLIIIDTDVLIEISDKRSKKGDYIYQKIISSEDNVAITSITM